MTPAAHFLTSFAQCLATMSLYDAGHPARERVLDGSYERLVIALGGAGLVVTFLDDEVLVGGQALEELRAWDWARRLAAAQVERVEIDAAVTRDEYERFVVEAFGRLGGRPADTSETRQLVSTAIRFGSLRVSERPDPGAGPLGAGMPRATDQLLEAMRSSIADEAAAVTWMHEEVTRTDRLPMVEVDAVVRSLSAAMQTERRMLLPLLQLKEFDQYTTTHACNVSVLAMGVAERLGLGRADVREFGVAGLLHDLGKVLIPREILVKPGKLTDEERTVMQKHPVDGARLVLERERGLQLAAVVAYEHHIYLNGEGYPGLRFPRACHYASRIVHVCDIYDALCTDRPYRAAWEPSRALDYLEERAGMEVDPVVVKAFTGMVREAVMERTTLEV